MIRCSCDCPNIPLFHADLIRLLPERNSYFKGGSFTDLALDRNLTMMIGNDLFCNRKPQPGPRGLGAEHEIKDFGEMIFGDAQSVILNDEEDILLRSPGEKMYFSSFRNRLNTIDEEVRNR